MKSMLTQRQKELLSIIYTHIKNSGYPPSFEEMREELGVASNQSVIDLLKKLTDQRLINKDEGTARGVKITPLGCNALNLSPLLQLMGTTSAGIPAQAIVEIDTWHELKAPSEKLRQLKGELIMLHISGDSMVNAGINDGDLILVRKQNEFSSQDIVLARIGFDEFTVKRFISQDKPPYEFLKPENPKYENIYFTDDVEMVGKVLFVYQSNTLLPLT